MTYIVLALLVAALAYALRGSLPEMRVEMSKLTTCAHCADTGECRRSCCGAVDVAAPCRECDSQGGSR